MENVLYVIWDVIDSVVQLGILIAIVRIGYIIKKK